MIKKLKWILLALVLIVVIVIGGVFVYADRLTKVAVETAGTQALGVTTTLEKAKLSLLGGSVSLTGLQVDNPEGYQTDFLLKMGNGTTKIDLGSITSDTIQVEIIRLENLEMTIEQKGLESNLGQILKNIEEYTKTQQPKPKDESGKKITFQRIEIIKPVARIKLLPIPGQVEVLPIELGDITLENISEDRDKADLTVVVIQKIMVSLAEAVVKSGAELPGDLIVALGESVEAVAELTGEGLKVMLEGTGVILGEGVKVLEEVGKGVDELLKLPGNILKSDKKDKDKVIKKNL
ncbi:hypothetical protein ACFL02_02025 [Planctomycetota bacterium]